MELKKLPDNFKKNEVKNFIKSFNENEKELFLFVYKDLGMFFDVYEIEKDCDDKNKEMLFNILKNKNIIKGEYEKGIINRSNTEKINY